MTPADYVVNFFVALLPAAVFGLIAGPLALFRVGRRGQENFFGLAALFGAAGAYCVYSLYNLNVGDCFDDCVVRSAHGSEVIVPILTSTIPAVIVPAVLFASTFFRPRASG